MQYLAIPKEEESDTNFNDNGSGEVGMLNSNMYYDIICKYIRLRELFSRIFSKNIFQS